MSVLVLVVDDEPDIRTLIGDILTDEGHGVRMAWDSDTALGEIERTAPDLVILDIWLVIDHDNICAHSILRTVQDFFRGRVTTNSVNAPGSV